MSEETLTPAVDVPADAPVEAVEAPAPVMGTGGDAAPEEAPAAPVDAPAQSRNELGQFTAAPSADAPPIPGAETSVPDGSETAAPAVDAAPSPEPAPETPAAPEPAAETPAVEAPAAPVALPGGAIVTTAPVEEALPEPPNSPPPSLDPTVEKPAVPGLEGHVQLVGDLTQAVAALTTERDSLAMKVKEYEGKLADFAEKEAQRATSAVATGASWVEGMIAHVAGEAAKLLGK